MFDMFNESSSTSESYSQPPSPSPVSGDLFVISIGGSLLIDSKPDSEKIRAIANAISEMHNSGKKIVLVVGGGKTARTYVECLADLGANNFDMDLLGIHITRANAMLVANAIPEANKKVLTEITDAKNILDSGKIPVFGGIMPFFTTDAVAALLSEYLGGTFVNLTNVNGVYDSDPNKFENAVRFEEVNYDYLISLVSESGSKPGQNVVLDLACCMILKRSNIVGVVLNGNDLENLKNFVNGYSYTGTLINATAPFPEPSAEEKFVKKRIVRKKPSGKKTGKSYDDSFSPRDVNQLDF